jgi:hypothetical protein
MLLEIQEDMARTKGCLCSRAYREQIEKDWYIFPTRIASFGHIVT